MPYTEKTVRQLIVQRRIFLALNCIAAVAMAILLVQHKNLTHRQNVDRRETLIRACRDQNARHDKTIATLNELIAKLPQNRQKQAQASKQFTILLINALAPDQDCQVYADRILAEKD